MFDKLRLQIGTSYARFHFRAVKDPIVRFTEAVTDTRRPVVFLPELETEAAAIDGVLKFLADRYHTSKVVLVARKNVMAYVPENRGFNVVTFDDTELDTWYVPRPDLLRKVKKSTFDVAFDLNIGFALPSSYLCRVSQAPLRIGFKKPYADSFYNFQVQTGPPNNLAQVYAQLLKCIEMF
jgi:hypothetical protein